MRRWTCPCEVGWGVRVGGRSRGFSLPFSLFGLTMGGWWLEMGTAFGKLAA